MRPADALRRIADLLEAEGANAYKPQAFRRAASAVDAAGEERVAVLNGRGQLETLEGIGKSTAAVISQVLAGAVPEYLEELGSRAHNLPPGPARALRELLRGDCHSHSDWSDGGSTIEEMALAARDAGHEYLVLTDHSPRLKVAHGLSADALRSQMALVSQLNADLAPFRLLTGIEVDILEDGRLDQEEDLLAALDVVVASVHSELRMAGDMMTARMVAAVQGPNVDILGHCTGRRLGARPRPQSSFDPETVFSACAASGTAVEINSRPDRRDPPPPLLRVAAQLGCSFSIDSDAHAPGQLSWLYMGCEQAVEVGIEPESIVNTLPLEEFLAWAGKSKGPLG